VPDNAIVTLARALEKVHAYQFPLQFNDTTRAYFTRSGAIRGDETGRAMVALAANPGDGAAEAVVNRDKMLHSLLRDLRAHDGLGGPCAQRFATKGQRQCECRMFPGNTSEQTMAALVAAIGDPSVNVVERGRTSPSPRHPDGPQSHRPDREAGGGLFPGVPVVPAMSTGASDAVYTGAVGIPTYGVPGVWGNPDGDGIHGLNERIEVRSLLTGRAYLYDLIEHILTDRCQLGTGATDRPDRHDGCFWRRH
jgi:acetylornithine deacetylase/succinyl-diaminopimelate desuccinylase-like protein